jgi:hypothetical protein
VLFLLEPDTDLGADEQGRRAAPATRLHDRGGQARVTWTVGRLGLKVVVQSQPRFHRLRAL